MATLQRSTRSNLIQGIGRVDLRVRDVDRAVAFYRDVVGLKVSEMGASRAELGSREGPAFLVLDSAGATEAADLHATGLFHTAFRFPKRVALGDALSRVVAAGLELGAGDHLVSEALYVDDPDGNGVELYWDRPVEQWPAPTDDALVPMATLPVDLDSLYREGSGPRAMDQEPVSGTDVGHVHLQVSDLERTIRFYADVLGLDLTARLGRGAGFFSSNGYHHNIGANSWRSRGSKAAAKSRAGLERVTFAVAERDQLEELGARLRRADVAYSEDGAALVLWDPDGIELRFTIDRGTEEAPEGRTA
jgi:catechol 2,3-dioxygenase